MQIYGPTFYRSLAQEEIVIPMSNTINTILKTESYFFKMQVQVRAAQPDGDEGGGDPRDLGDRAARHLHGLPLLPRAHARQGIAQSPLPSFISRITGFARFS